MEVTVKNITEELEDKADIATLNDRAKDEEFIPFEEALVELGIHLKNGL